MWIFHCTKYIDTFLGDHFLNMYIGLAYRVYEY